MAIQGYARWGTSFEMDTKDGHGYDSIHQVQASYDWVSQYSVELKANADCYPSTTIRLTPNEARQLAAYLCFAANDAETLNQRDGYPYAE